MKNNKLKSILSLINMAILFNCSGLNPEDNQLDVSGPTEPVQNGAYFSGDENVGGAYIYGEYITLVWNLSSDISDVIRFSLEGDSYKGKNVRTEISFKMFGDDLTVYLNSIMSSKPNRKFQFKRIPSVGISEEEPIQLPPPPIVGCSPDGIAWFPFEHLKDIDSPSFELRNNGIFGAGVEVKSTVEEDFKAVWISDFIGGPAWFFDINFVYLHLAQGTHVLRVKYLGGPFVKWDPWNSLYIQKYDGEIQLSLDSQPLYFKLTVDSEGNFSAEEISE